MGTKLMNTWTTSHKQVRRNDIVWNETTSLTQIEFISQSAAPRLISLESMGWIVNALVTL